MRFSTYIKNVEEKHGDSNYFAFKEQLLEKAGKVDGKRLKEIIRESLTTLLTKFNPIEREKLYGILLETPLYFIPTAITMLRQLKEFSYENFNLALEFSGREGAYLYLQEIYSNMDNRIKKEEIEREVKKRVKKAKETFDRVKKEVGNFINELYSYYRLNKNCKGENCKIIKNLERYYEELFSPGIRNNILYVMAVHNFYKKMSLSKNKEIAVFSYMVAISKASSFLGKNNVESIKHLKTPYIREGEEETALIESKININKNDIVEGIEGKIATFNLITHEGLHYAGKYLNENESYLSEFGVAAIRDGINPPLKRPEEITEASSLIRTYVRGRRDIGALKGFPLVMTIEYPSVLFYYLLKDKMDEKETKELVGKIKTTKIFPNLGELPVVDKVDIKRLENLIGDPIKNSKEILEILDKYEIGEGKTLGDYFRTFKLLIDKMVEKGVMSGENAKEFIISYLGIITTKRESDIIEQQMHIDNFYSTMIMLLGKLKGINDGYVYIEGEKEQKTTS